MHILLSLGCRLLPLSWRLALNGKRKISWWVPRWAFVPALWRSLGRCILNRRSLTSIIVGSVLSCATVLAGFKLAFPGMVVPNLWPVALSIPGIVVAMVLQFVLLTMVPPHVVLRSDRLQKSHGQTGLQIKATDIIKSQIYIHSSARVRLKIRYRQRSGVRTLVLGIASCVDLDELDSILPSLPKIRDARFRRISLHECT